METFSVCDRPPNMDLKSEEVVEQNPPHQKESTLLTDSSRDAETLSDLQKSSDFINQQIMDVPHVLAGCHVTDP